MSQMNKSTLQALVESYEDIPALMSRIRDGNSAKITRFHPAMVPNQSVQAEQALRGYEKVDARSADVARVSRMAQQAKKVLTHIASLPPPPPSQTPAPLSPSLKTKALPVNASAQIAVQKLEQLQKNGVDLKRFYAQYDIHRSGKVSYKDFADTMLHLCAGVQKEDLYAVASALDTQKSGSVHYDTLLSSLKQVRDTPTTTNKSYQSASTAIPPPPPPLSTTTRQREAEVMEIVPLEAVLTPNLSLPYDNTTNNAQYKRELYLANQEQLNFAKVFHPECPYHTDDTTKRHNKNDINNNDNNTKQNSAKVKRAHSAPPRAERTSFYRDHFRHDNLPKPDSSEDITHNKSNNSIPLKEHIVVHKERNYPQILGVSAEDYPDVFPLHSSSSKSNNENQGDVIESHVSPISKELAQYQQMQTQIAQNLEKTLFNRIVSETAGKSQTGGLATLQKLLRQQDVSHSGLVSAEELRKAFQKAGVEFSEQEHQLLYRKLTNNTTSNNTNNNNSNNTNNSVAVDLQGSIISVRPVNRSLASSSLRSVLQSSTNSSGSSSSSSSNNSTHNTDNYYMDNTNTTNSSDTNSNSGNRSFGRRSHSAAGRNSANAHITAHIAKNSTTNSDNNNANYTSHSNINVPADVYAQGVSIDHVLEVIAARASASAFQHVLNSSNSNTNKSTADNVQHSSTHNFANTSDSKHSVQPQKGTTTVDDHEAGRVARKVLETLQTHAQPVKLLRDTSANPIQVSRTVQDVSVTWPQLTTMLRFANSNLSDRDLTILKRSLNLTNNNTSNTNNNNTATAATSNLDSGLPWGEIEAQLHTMAQRVSVTTDAATSVYSRLSSSSHHPDSGSSSAHTMNHHKMRYSNTFASTINLGSNINNVHANTANSDNKSKGVQRGSGSGSGSGELTGAGILRDPTARHDATQWAKITEKIVSMSDTLTAAFLHPSYNNNNNNNNNNNTNDNTNSSSNKCKKDLKTRLQEQGLVLSHDDYARVQQHMLLQTQKNANLRSFMDNANTNKTNNESTNNNIFYETGPAALETFCTAFNIPVRERTDHFSTPAKYEALNPHHPAKHKTYALECLDPRDRAPAPHAPGVFQASSVSLLANPTYATTFSVSPTRATRLRHPLLPVTKRRAQSVGRFTSLSDYLDHQQQQHNNSNNTSDFWQMRDSVTDTLLFPTLPHTSSSYPKIPPFLQSHSSTSASANTSVMSTQQSQNVSTSHNNSSINNNSNYHNRRKEEVALHRGRARQGVVSLQQYSTNYNKNNHFTPKNNTNSSATSSSIHHAEKVKRPDSRASVSSFSSSSASTLVPPHHQHQHQHQQQQHVVDTNMSPTDAPPALATPPYNSITHNHSNNISNNSNNHNNSNNNSNNNANDVHKNNKLATQQLESVSRWSSASLQAYYQERDRVFGGDVLLADTAVQREQFYSNNNNNNKKDRFSRASSPASTSSSTNHTVHSSTSSPSLRGRRFYNNNNNNNSNTNNSNNNSSNMHNIFKTPDNNSNTQHQDSTNNNHGGSRRRGHSLPPYATHEGF